MLNGFLSPCINTKLPHKSVYATCITSKYHTDTWISSINIIIIITNKWNILHLSFPSNALNCFDHSSLSANYLFISIFFSLSQLFNTNKSTSDRIDRRKWRENEITKHNTFSSSACVLRSHPKDICQSMPTIAKYSILELIIVGGVEHACCLQTIQFKSRNKRKRCNRGWTRRMKKITNWKKNNNKRDRKKNRHTTKETHDHERTMMKRGKKIKKE